MSRTIEESLPEFATTYLETVVDPILATLTGIEFQVKTAEDVKKAKELFEKLKTQMIAREDARGALKKEADKLSDAEAVRVLNAISEKEGKMVAMLGKVVPLVAGLKGGRRSKTRKGRLTKKATRRGRKPHF